MLDFQVSTIVFTVINLLVLYFILRKLLFGRVNAVLEQRAARVKETIDSAEASKSQAEELRAEYEDKLTDARQEAAKLVADAQNRAQRAYEAKMADAETDAKRLRSEAEAQICPGPVAGLSRRGGPGAHGPGPDGGARPLGGALFPRRPGRREGAGAGPAARAGRGRPTAAFLPPPGGEGPHGPAA